MPHAIKILEVNKLKTIGLLGGMSWESSAEYYRIINETVKEKLSGLHSAKIIMYSIDFEELEKLQREGKWEEATDYIIEKAKILEKAGVDFILICSNTGHEGAEETFEANINVPLLHIVDVTAKEIASKGIKKVGLLGTKYTMEKEFFKKRLKDNYGIDVVAPDINDREIIHKIIYNELCLGILKKESKEHYQQIIKKLVHEGAEGIILGCTEICFLIKQEDCSVPLFDTTTIHAKAAVDYALKDAGPRNLRRV